VAETGPRLANVVGKGRLSLADFLPVRIAEGRGEREREGREREGEGGRGGGGVNGDYIVCGWDSALCKCQCFRGDLSQNAQLSRVILKIAK
jgi:hypothetical protein